MIAEPTADRGDRTREKLLNAAIDVFGRHGFDGATTRMLAEAAGVNQQAIPYYFGGKDGLYVATADFIAAAINLRVKGVRERIRTRLAGADAGGGAIGKAQARALLGEIVQRMATLFAGSESEPWARFIVREQMQPTEAFRRLYDGVMSPLLDVICRLVGILLAEPAESEHVRLRSLSLLGSVLVYRMAHAATLAKLEWKQVGPREMAAIQALATELVATIRPARSRP